MPSSLGGRGPPYGNGDNFSVLGQSERVQKVLITGVTSFTGAHIARAFGDAGWSVTATLTQNEAAYADPLFAKRREYSRVRDWRPEAPLGTENFLKILAEGGFEVWINHGASIKGYRQADFDYLSSLQGSTHNLEKILETFKAQGGRQVIHTGSVYEADEGQQPYGAALSSAAVSIYGLSKKLVWELLRFRCEQMGLALTKIVIPNPVGPLENSDRMFPLFARMWREGKVPEMRTPQFIRDNVPAYWLGSRYREVAEADTVLGTHVLRPSAFRMSNEEFLTRFLAELSAYRKDVGQVKINAQAYPEPLSRVNPETCPEYAQPAAQKLFFKEWFADLELI